MVEKDFDKKNELFQAALKEFSENSYEEASLNKILKNSGSSKGFFYYNFKNKKELYLFVLDKAFKVEGSYIEDFMKKNIKNINKISFFDYLRLEGKADCEFSYKYPQYFSLWMRVLRENDSEVKPYINEIIDYQIDAYVTSLVKNAIEKGEIRNDFSIGFTTKLIKNLFINFIDMFIEDISDFEYDKALQLYDDYLDFVENGLGKK